jgi:hypothetical protein
LVTGSTYTSAMVLINIDVGGSVVFINPDQIASLTQSGGSLQVNMSDGVSYTVKGISVRDFIAYLKSADHYTVTG